MSLAVVLAASLLLVALLGGCGSGSFGDSTTSRGVGSGTSTRVSDGQSGAGRRGGGEFRVPGGKQQEVNRIISGTKEASTAEIEAAGAALAVNLEARADRDWAGQCKTLSKKMASEVEANGVVIAADQSCAENLGAAGRKAPRSALADTMNGTIGALRLVNGRYAFAFYHGAEGRDYLIPMEREGGEWKVAALTPEAIPGT